MVSVSQLAPKIKPGILEILTALGTIIKSHLSLASAMGKRLLKEKNLACLILEC